jgi:hypothetical protein
MNSRETIREKLRNGSEEERSYMLQACEECVINAIAQQAKGVLDDLSFVDQEALSKTDKERFLRIFKKLSAINAIMGSNYENMTITQATGHQYVRETLTGRVLDVQKNGREACMIAMWSGMPEFSMEKEALNS